jgi:hypothetical protein
MQPRTGPVNEPTCLIEDDGPRLKRTRLIKPLVTGSWRSRDGTPHGQLQDLQDTELRHTTKRNNTIAPDERLAMDRFNRHEWKMLAHAYGTWVRQHVEDGWEASLLTFIFVDLRGPPWAVSTVMTNSIEAVYAAILTRMFRHPKRLAMAEMPLWICSPDYPVIKREGGNLVDMLRNDGLHAHAVAVIPPDTRLGCSLSDHIDDQQAHYSGPIRSLWRVHAVPITHRIEFVTDYALQGLKDSRVGRDAFFVLPRRFDELPVKSPND